MAMTVLQFITSPIHGCCTTGELMAFSKQDKEGFENLKVWAKAEMEKKGLADVPAAESMTKQ